MTTLTPDEQRAVRALGGWMILDLLASPDAGWTGAEAGGSSHARGWPGGHGIEYNRTSLRILETWPSGTVVVEAKWTKVARHAKTLSPGLVERVRAHRRDARQHQAAYPSPYPGIGRPYCWDSREQHTGDGCEQCIRDRADLAAANERVQREREAWYLEGARLRDVEQALLSAAFPLADAPAEPDLLAALLGAS